MATRPKAVIESRNGEKLSPITIAKNVLTDDGQNLHDILSDRKEDMMTPTIENSSSMFKVGQGDGVDYSSNVVNGAYESMVLKGRSLVNILTNATRRAKHVQNFVSSNGKLTWNTVSTWGKVGFSWQGRPNTAYYFTWSDKHESLEFYLRFTDSLDSGTQLITTLTSNGRKFTTNSTGLITLTFEQAKETTNSWIKNPMLIEYVEGMENWGIPYFEGICDVRSPILSNVGKNLFNINNHTESQWSFSNGYPYEQNASYGDRLKILGDEVHFSTGGGTVNKGVGYYIPLCKNKDYTFRINKKDGNGNYCVKLFLIHSSEYPLKQAIQQYSKFGINNEAISSSLKANFNSANYDMCAIYIGGGWESGTQTTRSYVFNNISLTESNQQVEPYKSNTTTFDQKDGKTIVLRSLPNGVCDTLNVETREYVQRIGEIVLDGSENWVLSFVNQEGRTPLAEMILNGANSNKMPICDKLIVNNIYSTNTNLGCSIELDSSTNLKNLLRIRTQEIVNGQTLEEFKQWLSQNPITIQYELATPNVKQVNVEGYPYAYENGHVLLESGSIGQSLTPKVEYSVVTNRNGQIRSNQKMVERHQKQLDRLQAMVLTNLVNAQYEQTLTNLKYDLKNVREEVK